MLCDLPNNVFEAATKKHWNLPKRIQIWKKTCVDKLVNVVQLLVQSDGETYCCCEILFAYMCKFTTAFYSTKNEISSGSFI